MIPEQQRALAFIKKIFFRIQDEGARLLDSGLNALSCIQETGSCILPTEEGLSIYENLVLLRKLLNNEL